MTVNNKNELIDVENIYQDIRSKIISAREKMFKHIDTTMTEVYWYVGKLTYELSENSTKASYGKKIIDALSSKLTKEFGSGFSSVSIRRMRRFYEMYPIWSTVSTELSWAHFQELIKIDRILPQRIIELTGITDSMLATGKMPKTVLEEFVNFVGNNVIIGHNVNFDLGFLCNKCKKYLDYNLNNDYIDTLYLARKLVPNSINHKLGTLAKLFNISYEGAHRGLKDVEITYEVYNKLREIG